MKFNGVLLNPKKSMRSAHFDNYFFDSASVHKYQTRLTILHKYRLPRMNTSTDQIFLMYVVLKIWSDIPKNLKS